ncbi:MAG: hypothetical protein HYY11_06375 [Candidatus Methylomirabilis oxyfera]|nr:hypothetical protein [Candidatus Methylomirabilis oxyfera]
MRPHIRTITQARDLTDLLILLGKRLVDGFILFILAQIFAQSAMAEGSSLVGKHLIFSAKYRVTKNQAVDEYLELGHYDFSESDAVELTYFHYDAGKNLSPIETTKRHGLMNAPYGRQCLPGPARIAQPEGQKHFTGRWKMEGEVLKIYIGTVVHEWRLQDPKSGLYRLTTPYYDKLSGSHVVGDTSYSDAVGFGYVGDVVVMPKRITRAHLSDSYISELYENNTGKPTANWKYLNTQFDLSKMRQDYNDEDEWGMNYPCAYENVRTGHRDVWCHYTLLLNYSPYTKAILYTNGGHDYNEDGCYNEPGHMFTLLGVLEGEKVRKFVFIEYSYQGNSTYPLLGVGRYYERSPETPSVTILQPKGGETIRAANSYRIEWRSRNVPAEWWVGKIVLYKGPRVIADIVPEGGHLPTSGSIEWKPPENIASGSDFKVVVILYTRLGDRSYMVGTGASVGLFSIVNPES